MRASNLNRVCFPFFLDFSKRHLSLENVNKKKTIKTDRIFFHVGIIPKIRLFKPFVLCDVRQKSWIKNPISVTNDFLIGNNLRSQIPDHKNPFAVYGKEIDFANLGHGIWKSPKSLWLNGIHHSKIYPKLTQFGVHSFDAVLMKVKVKGAKFALQNFILESQN